MPPTNPPNKNVSEVRLVTPTTELESLAVALLQDVTPARLLVASDFDGTLSPIVARPEKAAPVPGALAALQHLLDRGAQVAVISGRSRRALEELVPLAGVRLLGDYGLEAPSPAETEALRSFNAAVADLIGDLDGVVLEAKPGSSSIHYRDRPAAGPGLLEELRPIAAGLGLRAGAGRMVVEVRPEGADKGHALRRLLEASRPDAVVFGGDDEGDRAAFQVAARHPRHLVVGVRSGETAPDLFGACDAVVAGPPGWVAVLETLGNWGGP